MKRRVDIRPQAGPPVPISATRLFLVLALMLLVAVVTFVRLVDIQVIHHRDYSERANEQYTNRREIEPERGVIYDRRGNPLVTNLPNYWSIGVRPGSTDDSGLLVRQLANILDMDVQDVHSAFERKSPFVWVKRKVDPRMAQEVRALGRREIGFQKETLRRYPYGKTAGQVVGHVNVDNVGGGGVERVFNKQLSGRPGWEVLQRDARRREILDPAYPREAPQNGGKVVLSIDINAQAIAEEELAAAVKKYNAADGMIVVTRPATGEILAIASEPRYDPNDPGAFPAGARKNRSVTDVYEPGSTFKVVSFAGLLDRGLIDINELVFCENGRWHVADRVIRDSHPNAWLTARQVLEKSSNIGTAKLSERLTKREFYTVMRDFGFGQKTGIELPGEVRGLVPPPNQWSGVSHSNMAMGQGVAVTAIQLAMAYGAIANGGYLMKPMLVLSSTDAEGEIELEQPVQVRRVMRPGTARTLRHLLADAVEIGTGTRAIIQGLEVAGKTGTAQKVNQERNIYYQDRYVSSFAGFLPADRPELLAVVVIDDPHGQHYGGTVAAPVFRDVMQRLIVTLPRQEPALAGDEEQDDSLEVGTETGGVEVPALVSLERKEAETRLRRLGLNVTFKGEGEVVCSQETPPGTHVAPGGSVELVLTNVRKPSDETTVPDVRGMALRAAIAAMTREGLRIRVNGSGVVVKQSLKPGRREKVGTVCTVEARPSIREMS